MTQENKLENPSQKKVKRGSLLNEFFWICSGANREILRQCPTEYSKYFGIGGTIFFTAAMAALSGGYAFYTIFNDNIIAICFGIFWGLLIFNLDRFIVNTMYSDGKHTISWQEFKSGLPRIVIAVFLGVVISTPIEMKIFEDRIESQIVKDNAVRTAITQTVAQEDYNRRGVLEKQLQELMDDRKKISERISDANKALTEEIEGKGNSGKVGKGQIYQQKQHEKEALEEQLKTWDIKNKSTLDRIERELSTINTKIEQFGEDIAKGLENTGFCVRYEAFSNIKEEVPAVRIVALFIMLLFVIIETAPTIFKMMIESGPYDELLKEEMERTKAAAIVNVSKINADANTQIQISIEKNKEKLLAEVAANKEVLSKVAAVQAELLQVAIEEWRQQELIRIKEDPSKYIHSNIKKS